MMNDDSSLKKAFRKAPNKNRGIISPKKKQMKIQFEIHRAWCQRAFCVSQPNTMIGQNQHIHQMPYESSAVSTQKEMSALGVVTVELRTGEPPRLVHTCCGCQWPSLLPFSYQQLQLVFLLHSTTIPSEEKSIEEEFTNR
jgi:hypothetical protein